MECSELHIFHDLVLDKNVNDNACSTPLLHEVLDVNHNMLMLGIGLYRNKFSHICVKHHYYPKHDILCLYFFLLALFLYFPLSITPCLRCSLDICFWDCLARLTSLFCLQECIRICESIFLIPVFEHLTLIDKYRACPWRWYHRPPLFQALVYLYINQL